MYFLNNFFNVQFARHKRPEGHFKVGAAIFFFSEAVATYS